MKSAGLLITGNEVLSAKTKDTNGPFMGMHLRRLGIPVRASMMCADEESDLLECLHYLASKSDVILMTGGLGPTSDDLTADVVAKFFHIPLEFNQEAWDACADFFIKSGRTSIPESNKKQANLPKGCKLLPNKLGTAAGFSVSGEKNGKKVTIYSMPGVPYEMEVMFLEYVLPHLSNNSLPPIMQSWQVFFMGESFMQTAINEAEKALLNKFQNASISYQAHPNYVSYSVTLFPESKENKEECEKYLNDVFNCAVDSAFGEYIIYKQDKKVAQYIISTLLEKNLKISFIENSSAGYLTKEFSSISHDPRFFAGSFCLASRNIKENIFKIPHNILNNEKNEPLLMLEYLSTNSFQFTEADICLSEYGFPSDPYLKYENPPEGFYLLLSFRKSKFLNYEEFEKKLAKFSWKNVEDLNSSQFVHFSCFLKSNKRHVREIQQLRACIYLLCSLAKIL
ncbi:competence/damage-inducible protein A [Silvanigrella aquatica]|uniref:MoaB/Mog domain-containing protein n=1 Tax=Silvanigrella aquatica TaxID=1915309 RepID=A0A1L4CZ81_9BACT|nr:molybdopterin-binding protein [Silvanigrella aquatica]APJ03247.1 hypothetical protein AXG55_04740 [Silvanigrella aquatica]